jgi:RNA polymerase-binding transcription factor DksA
MAASIESLKQKLLDQRDQLLEELDIDSAPAEGGIGYGTHQADDGTFAFEQAADQAVRRNAKHLLYEVDRALTRIEEGRYGLCRRCGNPIDPARLNAIPYARYCLDCAEHSDLE